jgi:hypothetical protein
MAWIPMRTNLLSDPRVVRISSALQADRLRTVGGLFAVWCLGDDHADLDSDDMDADALLPHYTAEAVDDLVGLPGLGRAMVDVDWAEETPKGFVLKRFGQWNGRSTKRRIQDAESKRRRRNVRDVSAKCPPAKRTDCGLQNRTEQNRTRKTPPAAPGPPAGAGNPTIADLVERVRLAYPRKVAPDKARAAIEKAARRMVKQGKAERVQTALTMLQARAAAYAASPAGQRVANGDKDIRPYPATWFNQGRYEDDQTEWLRPNGQHHQTRRESPEELADRLIRETEASERGRLRLTGGAE